MPPRSSALAPATSPGHPGPRLRRCARARCRTSRSTPDAGPQPRATVAAAHPQPRSTFGTPQTARDRWPSSYSSAAPGCHADGLARTRVWFDGGPVRCFATIGRQLTRRPRLPDGEALEKAAAQPDSSCQPGGAAESGGGFRGWHRFLQHEVDELRQREAIATPAVPPQHGPGGDQVVPQPLAHPVGGHDAVVQHGRARHLNDVTAPAEQTQRILVIFSGVEWSATPEGRIEQSNTIYCLAADARVGGEPAEAAGKAR